MKLGACLLMFADTEDPLAKKYIPMVKAAGYDYAEVPLARLIPLSDKELEDYLVLFRRNHLPIEAFNNSIPEKLPLIGSDFCEKTLQEYIDKAVSLAYRMGVEVITMCGPIRSWVQKDFDWSEGFAQYTAFMQMYADAASRYGITLAIEPINSEENGFISTIAEACEVVEACKRSNIKIVVDFYHFYKEDDDWNMLLRCCKNNRIAHVHYAAQEKRSYPLEKDREACERVFHLLQEAGYKGRVSIEARTTMPEHDLSATCALMRKVLKG